MKFSTRTTYGLRAIVRLAKNWGKGSLSLPSIARAENISLGYLERLFSKLKKADFIIAEKGVSGGYTLSKSPQKINILEIVEVLEGKMAVFYCLDANGKISCSSGCKCSASLVLSKVQKAISEVLKKIKLSDLT